MANPLAYVLKIGKGSSRDINTAISDALTIKTYTVAQLAAFTPIANYSGNLVRCSNGNAGQPCLAFCDGTSWLRIPLGAAVATS